MKILKRCLLILLMAPTIMIDTGLIVLSFIFKGEDRDFELIRWLDRKVDNEIKK